MFGRQGRVSGETCPACASRAGVRTLIVLLRSVPEGTDRERTGQDKPVLGKGGRKGDAR